MGKPVDDQELRKTQGRLLKLALQVYEDLMADGKPEVMKSVADKVFEMHGMLGKTSGPNVDFHLNIPPEYFGEVFRGLQRITVVAQETSGSITPQRELPFTEAEEEHEPVE